MSLTSPQTINFIPRRTVSLEGIGAESAITIQRAVEQYGNNIPERVLSAAQMVMRSEIRAQMPAGDELMSALACDETEIMEDVVDHKVLGMAETAFADEKAYEQAAPEDKIVTRSTVKYMAHSLRLMQLASEGPDQLSAKRALTSLKQTEANSRLALPMVSRSRWAGQLVRARVSHAG
jgi:hypothetical protein